MPGSKIFKKRQGGESISFNMTPMIDCTFLLILFFLLTTQTASKDFVQLTVPKPDLPIAEPFENDGRTLLLKVTVAPYTDREIEEVKTRRGQAKFFMFRGKKFDPEEIGKLVSRLKWCKHAEGEGLETVVEIRADRHVHYGHVQKALEIVREAEIGKMHLTVKPEERG